MGKETGDQQSSGRLADRENVQRMYGEVIKINAEFKERDPCKPGTWEILNQQPIVRKDKF